MPDDRTVREKIAAREHADSAGIFDLLAVIGRDCMGALRFVPEGVDPGDPAKMTYRLVSNQDGVLYRLSQENIYQRWVFRLCGNIKALAVQAS